MTEPSPYGAQDLPLISFDAIATTLGFYDPDDVCELEITTPALQASSPYRVIDLYCQDPLCHCHKVTLNILGNDFKTYATIAYGWKSATFYRKWGSDKITAHSLTKGFLDPLEPQSELAPILLSFFSFWFKKDPNFVKRFKKRYTLFKEAVTTYPSLIVPFPKPGATLPENVPSPFL